MDPVAGAAKAARVLRPGGRLAVFWNAAQLPADLAATFADVYRSVQPGLPFAMWTRPAIEAYQIMCGRAADGVRQAGDAFSEPEQWRLDWDHRYARDQWLEQVPTIGGHTQLDPAKLNELLAGMGAAIDDLGGCFTMNYATVVVTAARA